MCFVGLLISNLYLSYLAPGGVWYLIDEVVGLLRYKRGTWCRRSTGGQRPRSSSVFLGVPPVRSGASRPPVPLSSYLTAAVVNLKRLAKAADYLSAWIRHAVDWMVERFVQKARIELLVQLRSTGLVHRHLRIA